MGALTAERPKCMLPVAGRPLLHHTMSRLRDAGCDEVVVIDIKGSLTLGSHEMERLFKDLLARGDRNILVNMADVTYMDSTSIGDLVVGHLESAKQDARFKLVSVPPRIVELLTMHHLIQVFECFDDEADAVASFAG